MCSSDLSRSLSRGEATLLFPGGAREVFKRKGEAYSLFWPDDPAIVRLAARTNATLLPFAGVGGDESFSIALDTDELLGAPLVGDLKYGAEEPLADRSIALHAMALEVPHPTAPEPVRVRTAAPAAPGLPWRAFDAALKELETGLT